MSNRNKTKEGTYSALTGFRRAVPIILTAIAVFCALCFITQDTGAFGRVISNVFLGLFSIGGYFIPALLLIHAIFYPSDAYRKRTVSRVIFSIIALIMISTIAHAITYWNDAPAFSAAEFYKAGGENRGGGVVGGTVAFALTAIFGYVGLVIIAALVFALYITYFFAGGKSTLSKILLKILTAISDFFSSKKEVKQEKQIKKAEKSIQRRSRELAEEQEELLDDEFFAADNGMKELSIPELGIREVRSDKELEANPVLQNKVHRTAATDSGTASSARESETVYKAPAEETPRHRVNLDYSTYDSVHGLSLSVEDSIRKERPDDIIYEQAPANKAPGRYGLDEDAADVFTSDFDPFDLKLNEELTNKQSSKVPRYRNEEPEGISEFTEPVSEISEEEINKARQRADFEMKKRAALDAQRQYDAAKEELARTAEPAPAEAVVEEPAPVTVHEAEPFIPEYMKDEPALNRYTEPEQTPVVVDFTEEEAESVRESLKVSRTMLNPTPAPAYTAEPEQEPASAYTPASTPAYTHTPEAEPAPSYAPAPSQSYGSYAAAAAPEPSISSMGFEFETEAEEDEEELLEEFTEEAIFEAAEPEPAYEEIPEAEQNKDVKEFRGLFNFLKEEDMKKAAEESPERLIEEVQNEPIMQYEEKTAPVLPTEMVFDDDFEEEAEPELIEETEEELFDEPPFEAPTYTPAAAAQTQRAAVQEKKEAPPAERVDYSDYKFPSFDLLARGRVEEDPHQEEEKNLNAEILVDSLSQFNVRVSIKGIDRGPRITRYEIVPARGVKVSSVTSLFNDVALKLGAEGIRMEAPIPGKSAIGVEIPNKNPSTVLLRDLVESDEFIRAESKTMCCLGKDVTGNPVFADIAKMPHVLVAGATGMGKSVCINAILMSILYKARPDEVKFIMIDPKKVEFKGYNGIPHLLIPVVTDVKQAAGALMWAVEQMEKRYEIMEQFDVKKIDNYNERVRENPELGEPLPKIIIVIDELNDIMLQVRKPAEDLIMSIAQKARAAGIHLIIGTQRPSVDVITGVIKANIPSRISCKVASYNDSKTILEQAGAEKLLNNGDMLYISAGAPKALRVQGAFVSDSEVAGIMKHIKAQAKGNIYDEQALEDINRAAQKCSKGGKSSDDDMDDGGEESSGILNDQQFLDAVELAIKSKKISTSLLQRKISIGYSKAAKYIDAMEDLGIVSEPNGQKPRDILITMDDWHEMLARRSLD